MCHIRGMRTFFGMTVLFLAFASSPFSSTRECQRWGWFPLIHPQRSTDSSSSFLDLDVSPRPGINSVRRHHVLRPLAADIVKMIESQPELESQLRRVRGGYLKIQGTWMPYEVRSLFAHMRYFPFPAAIPD